MNHTIAILHLYPDAVPDQDFRVEDHLDGLGPRITLWVETAIGAPQPGETELQAAYDEAMEEQAQEDAAKQAEKDAIDQLVASTDFGDFNAEDTQQAIAYLLLREKRRIDAGQ